MVETVGSGQIQESADLATSHGNTLDALLKAAPFLKVSNCGQDCCALTSAMILQLPDDNLLAPLQICNQQRIVKCLYCASFTASPNVLTAAGYPNIH